MGAIRAAHQHQIGDVDTHEHEDEQYRAEHQGERSRGGADDVFLERVHTRARVLRVRIFVGNGEVYRIELRLRASDGGSGAQPSEHGEIMIAGIARIERRTQVQRYERVDAADEWIAVAVRHDANDRDGTAAHRQGATDRVPVAAELVAPEIVADHCDVGANLLIGCEAASFARDVGLYLGHGYTVEDLRAFDSFPLTHHVECVAVLTR